MLKPMDIHNKEFKKAVRGYDMTEVDEFLDEIIVDYEQMQRELDNLRGQISSYGDNLTAYKERETTLNNTMIAAQTFADNLRKEAQAQAQMTISDAQNQARSILAEAENRINALKDSYAFLVGKYEETKSNLTAYLKAQTEMVEEYDADLLSTEDFMNLINNPPAASEESEETKINDKIKELMDSKIYKTR